MPLVIGRSCATITSRPFHLAELRPAMAMSSICSSTNSRKRRTSFLSILILATERKNRSNTRIPDGWVTRYLRSIDPKWPGRADTSRCHFVGDTEPHPQMQSRRASSAYQVDSARESRSEDAAELGR